MRESWPVLGFLTGFHWEEGDASEAEWREGGISDDIEEKTVSYWYLESENTRGGSLETPMATVDHVHIRFKNGRKISDSFLWHVEFEHMPSIHGYCTSLQCACEACALMLETLLKAIHLNYLRDAGRSVENLELYIDDTVKDLINVKTTLLGGAAGELGRIEKMFSSLPLPATTKVPR